MRVTTRSLPLRRPTGFGVIGLFSLSCLPHSFVGLDLVAIPTHALNFSFEGIETLNPDARRTEAREERFERGERGERRDGERILALAAADGVTHEPGLAQHEGLGEDVHELHHTRATSATTDASARRLLGRLATRNTSSPSQAH